ncbi:MAG: hypothetical protein Tsb0020_38020 [Haliangiales bacterium]
MALSACDSGALGDSIRGLDESEASAQDAPEASAQIDAILPVASVEIDDKVVLPQPSAIPWPEVPSSPGAHPLDFQAQGSVQHVGCWNFETFYLTSEEDFISLTSDPGGLFAPIPAGIDPIPPELAGGFMLTFQLHDLSDAIVGFGSVIENLDFQTLTGETAYSLMIPGRGTIAFTQDEDFAWVFDLVNDMLNDGVTQRTFDPPVVEEGAIPGTVQLLGGTGEFQGIVGYAREIQFVEELNLVTGQQQVGTILQFAYLDCFGGI